ncbi:unnamed protein product [Trichobilharzia regenti]|nr:unnamed protein product [Trichobilharzia regenti]
MGEEQCEQALRVVCKVTFSSSLKCKKTTLYNVLRCQAGRPYFHLLKFILHIFVPFTVSVPPTALMYLGTDLKDLTMYSQTIHFDEIRNGPAPRHDIITMHRHGHAFGGLPWLFWISLVLLIAVFHMFFCKIIYNELRGRNQTSENQNPWRLPINNFMRNIYVLYYV